MAKEEKAEKVKKTEVVETLSPLEIEDARLKSRAESRQGG